MKKLLFISLILLSICSLNAQTVMTQTDPAGAVATVNTNVDTSYHTITLGGQTFNYDLMTITIKGTKTSGTVGGAVTLWGSNNNVRWFALYGASTSAMADTVTTQSLSNGDNDLAFFVSKSRFKYVRARVITSGTQVSSYVCELLGRKVPN